MKPQVRIALAGDFNPDNVGHKAANEALQHAADALGLDVAGDWIPTTSLDSEAAPAKLARYDGVFSPGGAYVSKNGAIRAIQFAREQGWPFFAT